MFALLRAQALLHYCPLPARAEPSCHPDGPPSRADVSVLRASQHTLLSAPGNRHPSIPATPARIQWQPACPHHSEKPAAFASACHRGEFLLPARPAPPLDTSRQLKSVNAHACPALIGVLQPQQE